MNHRYLVLLLLVISLFALAGCRPGVTPKPTDSGVTPVPSTEAQAQPSDTPMLPTATPAPNKVVLLALAGADANQVVALQEALNELAAQDGLTVEVRQELAGMELEPDVRMVAVVPPDPGILNLAAANPSVPFLAVGIPGVQAAQNLSVVGSGGSRPDQQGFIAGYLAAVLTPDWRVGVISAPESPAGKAARNGFGKGVVFYCGLCRPAYPPFVQYPVFVDVPAGAGDAEIQAAVTTLVGNAVKTVYVSPTLSSATLLDLLAQGGFQIIATGAPPASVAPVWVASVSVDELEAVRQIWPRLLAGEEAISLNVPLALAERNPELFSPGRQQFVEKTLSDLLGGFIDTGIDPQTGDPD